MTTEDQARQEYKDKLTPQMALENLHNAARMIKADANTHTALQLSYLLLKGVIEKPDERIARRFQDGGPTQPPQSPAPPEDEVAESDPKTDAEEADRTIDAIEAGEEEVLPEPGPAKKVSTSYRTCKVVRPKPKKTAKKAAKKPAKKAGGGK